MYVNQMPVGQIVFDQKPWSQKFIILKKEHLLAAANLATDKLQQAGLNLGQVFNFRQGREFAPCSSFITVKQPNLKWNTRSKQLLGEAFTLLRLAILLNSLRTSRVEVSAVI
jgi:hypothetical protein